MQTFDLETFYKVSALMHYNGERKQLLRELMKRFLLNTQSQFDIDTELLQIGEEKIESLLIYAFKASDNIVTAGLDNNSITDYILERYIPYEETFLKNYDIPLSGFIYLALELWMLYAKGQPLGCNQFESKEEYGDLKFVAKPPKDFINKWGEKSTVSLEQFNESVKPLARPFIKKFVELYSFDLDFIRKNPNMRFREFPIFRHDNKLFLIDASAYFRYIPQKIHFLLNDCKSYHSKKGLIFEKMALDLLNNVPNSKLHKNIHYDIYELDGLLNLRRSSWFIECKSRNVSNDSLMGDSDKISNDIEKAIENSLEQASRAIEYSGSEDFKNFNAKKIKGIIIILEGIFPNIRLPKIVGENALDKSSFPVCVFNFFELKEILKQPDSNLFEEFLLWRSQKDMPIYAFDECDYWAYFNDNYRGNEESKKAFEIAKQKHLFVNYISKRFNNKDYLNKIMMRE